MPRALRKMGVALGLVEGEDLDAGGAPYERPYLGSEEYEEYGSEVRYARAEPAQLANREWVAEEADPRAPQYAVEADPVMPLRITTSHPRTYNDAREIGKQFRAGAPVIMDLSDLGDSEAKRLVDFASGLIFGLHGSIDRVTARVFLLTPQNTTVTAADKARIAEGSFFNQS
ncbi:MAG: cell division protein SepF [Actinomycetia bacterium]|nr:cell division protein SepF [Actinomycetes bacterium]